MKNSGVTRRTFLMAATSAGVAVLAGCPRTPPTFVTVFRRSGRGRHVSNAAKKHNANLIYASAAAAAADLAHPGDNSKVVPITISRSRYDLLFGNGQQKIDLRKLQGKSLKRG
jgi:hypothetical protein